MKKKRILVVDDEEQVVFVLRETLSRLGDQYEILTAHNGQEALTHMYADPVDLLMTDLIMPVMDGVALTEIARSLSPAIKVIWMTAYEHRYAEAERLAVNHYMCKPLDIVEIRNIARQVLGEVDRKGSPLNGSQFPDAVVG